MITRVHVPRLFEADGLWRDVYVFNMDEPAWATCLRWFRTEFAATFAYSVDGEPATMPDSIAPITQLIETASPHAEFSVNGIPMKVRFYSALGGTLELDYDPGEMTDARLETFIGWIRDLGKLLSRNVFVTEERAERVPRLVYAIDIDRVIAVGSDDRPAGEDEDYY